MRRKFTNSRFGLLLIVAMVASFLAVPTAALAQDSLSDPSAAQYDPSIPGSGVAGTAAAQSSGGASANAGLESNIGSLPFTGMDLIIVAGVAFVLTGTGFALRRLSMPRGPQF
jgi:hypothetical protein